MVLPRASRSVASIATSAARASGAAPPNPPECSSDASASTPTITSTTPRRLTVTAGLAHGRVPGVADQDRVGPQQVGVPGHEALQGPGGLLGSLDDQLQVDRHLVTEGPQRRQVRQDVALAVGAAAAVPAPSHLGQLERRGPPLGLVQRWLDVVVSVKQHGCRIRVRALPRPQHGLAPVRHLREPGIGEANGGKGVPHPPRRAGAFFRRELTGISHRPDGDQFRQFGLHPPHQAHNSFP